MKTTLLIATFALFTALPSFAQEQFDVVAACKKDCPKAKNNEDAHKCAEKKGRLNKEFRKSQCWEVNEKYEAAQAKGLGAEKDTH